MVNSRSWWGTERPGVLWFMGSQRVWHDWATELNWLKRPIYIKMMCVCIYMYIYTHIYIYKNSLNCTLSSVQSLSRVRLFVTPWITARQASLSITNSWSSLRLTSTDSVFFWNSLAFSMIQRMLAIWSLVLLPFLNPAWTSGSSWFMYCWSLVRRILSITLLACEMIYR